MAENPGSADSTPKRLRPLSPNIQIYRPQLTSVLSIANRITGLLLSLGAVGPGGLAERCGGWSRGLWRRS